MRFPSRHGLIAGALALLVSTGLPAAAPASAQAPGGPTIFAAASLKNVLDDIGSAWTAQGKPAMKVSLAASNTLAKQIEQGAPADLFFSADLDWMDYLAGKNLIKPESRVSLLSNAIVLIAPKDSKVAVTVGRGMDLAKALGDGRIAMGNVDAVPAGKYGKAALEKLGAWAGVKDKVAQADSVRAALLLVSRGEAPLGIVYATDAAADPNVKVVGTFPEDSHPPIVYPVAVLKDAGSADSAALLDFLRGPTAAAAFKKAGFTVLNKPHSGS